MVWMEQLKQFKITFQDNLLIFLYFFQVSQKKLSYVNVEKDIEPSSQSFVILVTIMLKSESEFIWE